MRGSLVAGTGQPTVGTNFCSILLPDAGEGVTTATTVGGLKSSSATRLYGATGKGSTIHCR